VVGTRQAGGGMLYAIHSGIGRVSWDWVFLGIVMSRLGGVFSLIFLWIRFLVVMPLSEVFWDCGCFCIILAIRENTGRRHWEGGKGGWRWGGL